MKQKEFAVNVRRNEKLGQFIIDLMATRGSGFRMEGALSSYRGDIVVYYDSGDPCYSDLEYFFSESAKEYDLLDARTDMGIIMDRLHPSVEIKLNSEYTAVVSPDRKTVTVGCQTFEAEKILEVAEALKS